MDETKVSGGKPDLPYITDRLHHTKLYWEIAGMVVLIFHIQIKLLKYALVGYGMICYLIPPPFGYLKLC